MPKGNVASKQKATENRPAGPRYTEPNKRMQARQTSGARHERSLFAAPACVAFGGISQRPCSLGYDEHATIAVVRPWAALRLGGVSENAISIHLTEFLPPCVASSPH